MTIYQVYLRTVEHEFCRLFLNQPTKKDIEPVVREAFHKESYEKQNEIWGIVLLLETIPNVPWLGVIPSIYGFVRCSEREVIENESQRDS